MHDVYGHAIPRYILANLHAQSWSVPYRCAARKLYTRSAKLSSQVSFYTW